jgi:hypothetical protein
MHELARIVSREGREDGKDGFDLGILTKVVFHLLLICSVLRISKWVCFVILPYLTPIQRGPKFAHEVQEMRCHSGRNPRRKRSASNMTF